MLTLAYPWHVRDSLFTRVPKHEWHLVIGNHWFMTMFRTIFACLSQWFWFPPLQCTDMETWLTIAIQVMVDVWDQWNNSQLFIISCVGFIAHVEIWDLVDMMLNKFIVIGRRMIRSRKLKQICKRDSPTELVKKIGQPSNLNGPQQNN